MLSYEILDYATIVLAFSIAFGVYELIFTKRQNRTITSGEHIFLIIGVVFLIWLLNNKELFHWNYNIATGEPVDHYSTYGKCMLVIIASIILNIASIVIRKIRKKNITE